jgi:hypothetical protein
MTAREMDDAAQARHTAQMPGSQSFLATKTADRTQSCWLLTDPEQDASNVEEALRKERAGQVHDLTRNKETEPCHF